MTPRRPGIAWSLLLDAGYLGLSPFLLTYLLVASRCLTRPKLRRGLGSKLWSTPRRAGDARSLWVHTVSVGEVLTAVPLIQKLREVHGDWDVRVSVSTYTGFEVAEKRLGGLPLFYFPLDPSPIVRRFFRRHRPTAVILLELELWPNFLLEAARRGVPVLVANARITERSARRYALGGGITRRLFNLVTSFGAQNDAYRERFLKVGVDPCRIEILGNLKHDREPSPAAARAGETRRLLGWPEGQTSIVVAGSTHPDEEKTFLGIHDRLRKAHSELRLVLVPRHVERLDASELSRWGATLPLRRWSDLRKAICASEPQPLGTDILVVDTLGELELFYALADIVFVGGSLVGRGGHNLFEAARLGRPVLFGPSFHNFQEEGELLLGSAAAVSAADEGALERHLELLLADPAERARLGRAALEVTGRLKGATERHVEWIQRHLRLYLGPEAC